MYIEMSNHLKIFRRVICKRLFFLKINIKLFQGFTKYQARDKMVSGN